MPTTPVLWAPGFQANTTDSDAGGDDQNQASVTQLATGNILVVWQSNASTAPGDMPGTDIIGQVFDPAGNKIGGEIRLNASNYLDDEGLPRIVALPNGGFVVAYEDVGGAHDRSARLDYYSEDGLWMSADSIAVDSAAGAVPDYLAPRIAYGTAGGGIAAYVRDNGNGDQDIELRAWIPGSQALGGIVVKAFDASPGAGGGIDSLELASLTNGNIALVYSDADSATDSDIDVQIRDSSGGLIVTKSVVSGTVRNDDVDIASLQGGGFVVTWASNAGGNFDILARLYDASGTALTGNISVATTKAGNQADPSVVRLSDDSFVVAWTDSGSGSLRGQHFSAAGAKLGSEFVIATGGLNIVGDVELTALADGRFTASWTSSVFGDTDVRTAIYDTRDAPNGFGGGNDVVAGTTGADLFGGGNGDDRLFGGDGNDTLAPGAGADLIDGGAGIDAVSYADALAGVQVDLTSGLGSFGAAGDVYRNIENAAGSAQVDVLIGNDQHNALNGQGDDDFLYGRGGDDTLTASGGTDNLYGGEGADVHDGFGSNAAARYDDADYGNLAISLLDPSVNTGAAAGDTYISIRNLVSGAGNDTLTGSTDGNILIGGGGSDLIAGLSGVDTLTGGEGNDTLDGGSDLDLLYGNLGNDTYVNPLGDQIFEQAGEGTDTVQSDASYSLEFVAEVERLFLTGSQNIDATGNALANQVNGNTGNNLLAGLGGADTLTGGAGGDTLQGGAGADRLTGGTQRDKLVPGVDSDVDTLVFNAVTESTGVTRDVITALDLNEDKLDLPAVPTAIAAAIGGSLSTATFNADLAAALTAAALPAGAAVLFDPTGGTLDAAGMVYLIVDANGVAGYQANADWVFQLESMTGTLTLDDFI